jgi:hypothetical protein
MRYISRIEFTGFEEATHVFAAETVAHAANRFDTHFASENVDYAGNYRIYSANARHRIVNVLL